jgi:hypothetical protein
LAREAVTRRHCASHPSSVSAGSPHPVRNDRSWSSRFGNRKVHIAWALLFGNTRSPAWSDTCWYDNPLDRRSWFSAQTNSAHVVARHAVANGLSSSLGDIVFGPPAEAYIFLSGEDGNERLGPREERKRCSTV